MSGLNNVNNSLIQSQLANVQLRNTIDVKIADKTLDNAKLQGDAALKLLDQAAQIAQTNPAEKPTPTLGALVSGLGQNLDIIA